VSRQDRLGALQVGVGGKKNPLVLLAAVQERPLELPEKRVDMVECISQPESQIGIYLVIAAPASVQFSASITKPIHQGLLDVHMNILKLHLQGKLPLLNFHPNSLQGFHDLARFLAGEDASLGEHLSMRDRTLDVMGGKPVVNTDAFSKGVNAAICRLAKDS
jgi:hypothetical protein